MINGDGEVITIGRVWHVVTNLTLQLGLYEGHWTSVQIIALLF